MSLYELYQELDYSEQNEVREYVRFLRDRVSYMKEHLRHMSREEREQFLARIDSPPAYSCSPPLSRVEEFHPLVSSTQHPRKTIPIVSEDELTDASYDEFMSASIHRQ